MEYPPNYWDNFFEQNKLGWDIGFVSTPLKEYFDRLTDKNIRILVPGAGNGWEVEYLFQQGFKNTFLLDFSSKAVESFRKRCPDFPVENIITENFFKHSGQYNLIVEQTFFTAIEKNKRTEYAAKMYELLMYGGKLVGLLFNHEFPYDRPPFGGTPEEYRQLFSRFHFKTFETTYNSIKQRKGKEIFIILEKKP